MGGRIAKGKETKGIEAHVARAEVLDERRN
jgi:hypothetical protein